MARTGDHDALHGGVHFVLIPWPAPGHMIPMLDIARLLAAHPGVAAVTVFTTPANALRIRSTIERAAAAGLPLRFVSLPFPAAEVGLPEGCESVDALPSRDLFGSFFAANALLREPIMRHLRSHAPVRPSCVISDVCQSWAHKVARALDVPNFLFHGYSCFSHLAIENLYQYKTHEAAASSSEPFAVPGMPHRVEITTDQLPRNFQTRYAAIFEDIREAEILADGFAVNSFEELEPGYAERFAVATGKKVWTLGPVSLCNQDEEDAAKRGDDAPASDAEQCMSWLDGKKRSSVIYVSFGSTGKFPMPQLMELGTGLLASGRPFVWVIKKAPEEFEEWLSAAARGNPNCFVIRGWAPQVLILSHPAVGGFMTHCGWNSTLEGVAAGVPFVTWPLQSDQFLNERLVAEVLGVGVAVGVEKPVDLGNGEEVKVVSREEVATAVERLMDGGEEGEERRRRAAELGRRAMDAVKEGSGSSNLSMSLLVQHVAEHAASQRAQEVVTLEEDDNTTPRLLLRRTTPACCFASLDS